MCGIAGILSIAQNPPDEILEVMQASLLHRGPDGQGVWSDSVVGLVHTRLSIIDLETGQQPLYSADGSLVLVANGEIYNYVELREKLLRAGKVFSTNSDSEVILNAYDHFGESFVEHLHGMFAFALFDRAREKLFLARDRLGIKPLFYALQNDRLVFGSEIKALLPALHQAPEIEPSGLAQFFLNQFSSGQETVFKGVSRLLPGRMLAIDRKLQPEIRQYWSPLKVATRAEISYDEAREEFDGLMRQVMIEHVRSDVPFGLFLSGGVDSAVLLALLNRFQTNSVRTYSVGFQDVRMTDELDDAGRIARHFGASHTPLRLSRHDIFSRLPHTIWNADDLMRDYACLPTSALAQCAAKELKVVFSGEGGDEVFAGYRRYRPSAENVFKNLLFPGSGGFKTRGQLQSRWVDRLFSQMLRSAAKDFRRPVLEAWNTANPAWSRVQKGQYTDLTTALPDNLLVKADRMLMGFGLEGRVPFLDHRVVEFGLSLPDELKIAGKQGKFFLKRWAEELVPKDHLYGPKRGFHVPVGEWLGEDFARKLGPRLAVNKGVQNWLQAAAVRELCRQQEKRQNVTREVWSVMQFAIWYNLFVENPGRVPSSEENPLDWI